jgi:GTP-binding protein Era
MGGAFRSGTVAILGRPNAGKSTFLNAVLGRKLAAVSPKPQTTRERLLGVHQDGACQIAFLDTPGLHTPHHAVSVHMLDEAEGALRDADAVLYLVDAQRGVTEEDLKGAERLRSFRGAVVVALNKTDAVGEGARETAAGAARAAFGTPRVHPLQAVNGQGIPGVLSALRDALPEGPPLFPEDTLTDKTVRELAADLIREQCFLQLRQEIPYGIAVEILSFEEAEPPEATVIRADLHVEKENQKGIVIGAKGSRLKAIGTAAREGIEALLEGRVFLELRVKVYPDWRKDPAALRRFGYGGPGTD